MHIPNQIISLTSKDVGDIGTVACRFVAIVVSVVAICAVTFSVLVG